MSVAKKVIIAVAAVLVVVGAVAAYIYPDREYWRGRFGLGRKVAAKIDNEVIYQSDYDAMAKQVAAVYGNNDHAKDIVPTMARTAVAYKLKIQPNAAEVNAQRKKLFPPPSTNFAWKTAAAFDAAIPQAIARQAQGTFSGAVLTFPFSQHFEVTSKPPAKYKDAATIASDRQYAEGKSNQVHNQIALAQLTEENAVAQNKADPRLVYASGPNDSLAFGKGTKLWKDDLAGNNDLINYISTLNIGLGKIRTKQVQSAISGQQEDGAFYFVDLKQAAPAQPTLQADYNKALKKQRVKIYIKQ